MNQVSPLTIEIAFEEVWDIWINKESESAGKKAVGHFLRQGNTKKTLIEVCRAYVLDNSASDPSFTYKLVNFLNGDHWKDILESGSLDKLEKKRFDSLTLINRWNESCKKHWLRVIDPDSRVALVEKA